MYTQIMRRRLGGIQIVYTLYLALPTIYKGREKNRTSLRVWGLKLDETLGKKNYNDGPMREDYGVFGGVLRREKVIFREIKNCKKNLLKEKKRKKSLQSVSR